MSADLTPLEQQTLKDIGDKIRSLREFVNKYKPPADMSRLDGWYHFLNIAKSILGNFNNDVSFVATLLAKRYLTNKHPGISFDAASKPQGAPGLDVDVFTEDNKRVVGEIKTVEPYGKKDFGAQQRSSFFKDFAKLSKAVADHKYLFLTEPRAFEVVEARYREHLRGVTVVCLSDNREFAA